MNKGEVMYQSIGCLLILLFAGATGCTISDRSGAGERMSLSVEWHLGERLPRQFQDSDGGIIHNKLVSACGFTTDGEFFNDVFALDLDDREAGWSTVTHYPGPPMQELFSVVIDDDIYYWGGFSYSEPYAYKEGHRLSYNKETDEWSWSPLPSLPWRVCSSGIAVIGNKIYLHGGADYDSNSFYLIFPI